MNNSLPAKWKFAQAYLRAFERLSSTPETETHAYWKGPTYHMLGMALELTFKAFLCDVTGCEPEKTHDLKKLYKKVRDELPNPQDFETTVGEECKRQWDLPEPLEHLEDPKVSVGYYVVWIQIDLLNRTFDKDPDSGEKFKTRYTPPTTSSYFAINTALLALTCRELHTIALTKSRTPTHRLRLHT